jgi:energy-converting hydrogenase Eha subunit F
LIRATSRSDPLAGFNGGTIPIESPEGNSGSWPQMVS